MAYTLKKYRAHKKAYRAFYDLLPDSPEQERRGNQGNKTGTDKVPGRGSGQQPGDANKQMKLF